MICSSGWSRFAGLAGVSLTMIACVTMPLSEQALGKKLPQYSSYSGDNSATISFSSDMKYETAKGVPRKGEPIICLDGVAKTTVIDGVEINPVIIPAGNEISVASVIRWGNSGWIKTCWPFVSFTPERGAEYVVVNEKIGGKGVSALWTGVAFQTCKVSVYKKNQSGFQKVAVMDYAPESCLSK